MKWILSHRSALEFWRAAQAGDALRGNRLRITKLPDKTMDAGELRRDITWRHSMPLHVLVGSANTRKVARHLRCHVSSGQFPGGSFIKVASKLAVCSPELCFLQMASELALPELVVLGYEFCGGYRLNKTADPRRGFRDDDPLTSVTKLRSYLDRSAGMRGHKRASRALRYVVEGSNSPMETILCMLLTLPYRLGGYGFPQPLLNSRLGATNKSPRPAGATMRHARTRWTTDEAGEARRAATGADASSFYGDLYWPDKRVDVEYDSDAYHSGKIKLNRDAGRRNTLVSAGLTVLTVSRWQIVRTEEVHKLAEALSARLGKRLKCSTPEFSYRHSVLRARLLPKISAER